MESDCGGVGSVFHAWNGAGFTIGERRVATAVTLQYGNDMGWISMVLVTAEVS
jgi:hypothetical protein